MSDPRDITYPGLPPSVISDPAWKQERVRTRASSNLSRATRRRALKRSPSPKGKVATTQLDRLQENILPELFLTSRKRFVRIAHRILENNEDAEDAVQDAFVSACRHFGKFEGRGALTTWLTRIVMNAALMARRKRKNARRSFHEMDSARSSFAETVPDTQPNPQLASLRAESYEILEAHVRKLNPHLREAVIATYYDELSVAGDGGCRSLRSRERESTPIKRKRQIQPFVRRAGTLLAKAHADLQGRGTTGKLVLSIGA